jgi:SAM-dependent methyltransferase
VIVTAEKKRELFDMLATLYAQQLATAEHVYMVQHSNANSIRRHVDVFARYLPHVADRKNVLDWGCSHAPDSCMLRAVLGDRAELHGCDFTSSGSFPVFHAFAKLQFTPLTDPLTLPYRNETFDAVIGSGALEHVAMVGKSLTELHRVMVEGGVLVVSFLPNRWSYTEFAARLLGIVTHRRRFGRREAVRLLQDHGFDPIVVGYSQFIPAHQLQGLFGRLWPLNGWLERLWPFRVFCSNHLIVAIRRSSM